MQKFKTTFEVDSSDLHLDFKDACARQEPKSDMTKELNKFMKSFVEAYKKRKEAKNV